MPGLSRVFVQAGAGEGAGFSDDDYKVCRCLLWVHVKANLNTRAQKCGAEMAPDADTVIRRSDVILKVSVPSAELLQRIPRNKILISYVFPAQ